MHDVAGKTYPTAQGAAVIVALTLQCEAFRQRVTTLGRSVAERARGRASGLKMVQLLSQENARKDVFLYNTEKREKEAFKSIDQSDGVRRVSFYSCGPTVYDYAHIGNFRAFLDVCYIFPQPFFSSKFP